MNKAENVLPVTWGLALWRLEVGAFNFLFTVVLQFRLDVIYLALVFIISILLLI
jgi:hypothetical protein